VKRINRKGKSSSSPATTFSYNERAIRAYTRAGFQVGGRHREAKRLGNQAFDVIYMDCLATDFQSSVVKDLLPGG
jgi:diamine N-acetyltransferase